MKCWYCEHNRPESKLEYFLTCKVKRNNETINIFEDKQICPECIAKYILSRLSNKTRRDILRIIKNDT
jgi:hypothetical protein